MRTVFSVLLILVFVQTTVSVLAETRCNSHRCDERFKNDRRPED